MKKFTLFLLLLNWFSPNVESQEVNFPPKFFTFRKARLGLGAGFEVGGEGILGLDAKPDGIKKGPIIINQDTSQHTYAYGLGLDLYSPFSLLGFYGEVNYNAIKIRYTVDENFKNDYEVSYLEVPLYLKIRTGGVQKRSHFLLLGGAGYSFPIGVKYNNSFVGSDNNKDRLSNNISYKGAIGYEFIPGRKDYKNSAIYDVARFVIWIKFTYRKSPFNTNYSNFLIYPVANSELKFNDYFFQIGFRFFLRIKQTGGRDY